MTSGNKKKLGRTNFYLSFYALLQSLLASIAWNSLKVTLKSLKNYKTWACFSFGFLGLFFNPSSSPSFIRLTMGAFIEEITRRALLQNQLEAEIKQKGICGVTYGNIITFVVFALAHLTHQPVFFAVLTFFPSLIFGYLWTKYKSTWLCFIMHLWYNCIYFIIVCYFSFEFFGGA